MKAAAAPPAKKATKPAAKARSVKKTTEPEIKLGPVALDILEKAARIRKALNGRKL